MNILERAERIQMTVSVVHVADNLCYLRASKEEEYIGTCDVLSRERFKVQAHKHLTVSLQFVSIKTVPGIKSSPILQFNLNDVQYR